MPPLRVLHVIPSVSPRDGGPTRAIGIMERALSEAGVEVTTLTTDHDLGPPGERCAPSAANGAHRIYAHEWLTPYKVAPGLVPHLMQAVAKHDVVHIHALFTFASTVAAWAARRGRVPYIVRPFGTLASYGLRARRPRLKRLSMALIESRILRGAAAVHFTSGAERAEAEALGLPMRGVVIPLGVDADDGYPAAPLRHEALAGRRVILFLSRLDPKKNLEALIEAVALSPMLRNSCALLVAGDGEPGYVASLKAKVAAAGLSDRTLWLGHVEGGRSGPPSQRQTCSASRRSRRTSALPRSKPCWPASPACWGVGLRLPGRSRRPAQGCRWPPSPQRSRRPWSASWDPMQPCAATWRTRPGASPSATSRRATWPGN